MENFKINKEYFVDDEPSEKVWNHIASKIGTHRVPNSIFARFHYRYVAVPVFLFIVFGLYMFFVPSTLDKQISQTEFAMNQLITMADTEVF